jgi:hypothetical protein
MLQSVGLFSALNLGDAEDKLNFTVGEEKRLDAIAGPIFLVERGIMVCTNSFF